MCRIVGYLDGYCAGWRGTLASLCTRERDPSPRYVPGRHSLHIQYPGGIACTYSTREAIAPTNDVREAIAPTNDVREAIAPTNDVREAHRLLKDCSGRHTACSKTVPGRLPDIKDCPGKVTRH